MALALLAWILVRVADRDGGASRSVSRDEISLGSGSAVAFPFGRGPAIDAATMPGAAPDPGPDADLPPIVAALGSEPAVSALYRLGSQARAGDARAAWDAFEVAAFCAETGPSGSAESNGPAQSNVAPKLERARRICDGVTPAQLDERYRYLQVAAEGAVPGAAVRMLDLAQRESMAEEGDGTGNRPPPLPGERAVELALRDARTGDVEALAAMTSVYQLGGIVAPDPDQALAFALATESGMAARAQDYSPGELALEHLLVLEYESKLGAERSVAAQQAASLIVKR